MTHRIQILRALLRGSLAFGLTLGMSGCTAFGDLPGFEGVEAPDVGQPEDADGDDAPDVREPVEDAPEDDAPDVPVDVEREVILAGTMLQPRFGHTATLLGDGRVFVFGGESEGMLRASGEVHDFQRAREGLTTVPGSVVRSFHTATLLGASDDASAMRVLVVGGEGPEGPLATAAIYDASDNTWDEDVPPMSEARARHTATRLPGGRVLVVGDASAEIYNPGTNDWTPTTPPLSERSGHRAALVDGRVFVVHGTHVEVFNAADVQWSTLASLQTPHVDGALIVAGGVPIVAGGYDPVTGDAVMEVERFESGFWLSLPPMLVPRLGHSVAAFGGRLWVVGGVEQANRCASPDATVRSLGRVDGEGAWFDGPRLGTPRVDHAEVVLPDGRWVFFGGRDISGGGCLGAFDTIEALVPVLP